MHIAVYSSMMQQDIAMDMIPMISNTALTTIYLLLTIIKPVSIAIVHVIHTIINYCIHIIHVIMKIHNPVLTYYYKTSTAIGTGCDVVRPGYRLVVPREKSTIFRGSTIVFDGRVDQRKKTQDFWDAVRMDLECS